MNDNPSKENGEGKENLSPTPPIRESEEGKERPPASPASARAREIALVAVVDVHTPPTLEVALAFAHVNVKCDDDEFVRAWYEEMANVYMWVNPKTGLPLRHWPAYLRASIINHRKPSEHKRRNHFGKRPVNWLAPTEGENYAQSPF